MIIDTTRPTDENEFIWKVKCSGSYYDNDPRGSGDISISKTVYVLANGLASALKKAESYFTETKRNSDKTCKVEATILTLETLIPAIENDIKRYHADNYLPVQLIDSDLSRYQLKVCLVKVEG